MEHSPTARTTRKNSTQQRNGGGLRSAPRLPPPRTSRDDAQCPPYRTPARPAINSAPPRGRDRQEVQLTAHARGTMPTSLVPEVSTLPIHPLHSDLTVVTPYA